MAELPKEGNIVVSHMYNPATGDYDKVTIDELEDLAVSAKAILAKIIAAPATELKQDSAITQLQAILAKIIAAPATEAKQDTLIAKDFATQTTLAAQLNITLSALRDAITASGADAKTLKDVVDKIEAARALLAATLTVGGTVSVDSLPTTPAGTNLIGKVGIDQTTDGTTNKVYVGNTANVALTGSNVVIDGTTYQLTDGAVLRGTDAIKPTAALAHAAIPYCYYFAIDTGVVEATDGTNWVVI